jgi:hypothetical protein
MAKAFSKYFRIDEEAQCLLKHAGITLLSDEKKMYV